MRTDGLHDRSWCWMGRLTFNIGEVVTGVLYGDKGRATHQPHRYLNDLPREHVDTQIENNGSERSAKLRPRGSSSLSDTSGWRMGVCRTCPYPFAMMCKYSRPVSTSTTDTCQGREELHTHHRFWLFRAGLISMNHHSVYPGSFFKPHSYLNKPA